ncbi:MAG TPA: hypothetical protein VIV11_19120 [Kofleriaceae bacterium]
MDLEDLIARDHAELDKGIEALSAWSPTAGQRVILDETRLGFVAHAEAISNVLHAALVHVPRTHLASRLLTATLAAHAEQEALLWRLARNVPNTVEWTETLTTLRTCTAAHHHDEPIGLLPLVRELLDGEAYAGFATRYATERLRALAMMSAVVARTRAKRGSAQV